MADSKLIVFAVVGVLVGAAIGVGIGFAAFNKNTDNDETYYFYAYFGDDDVKTGWYSVKASNANDAIEKAFKDKEGFAFAWSNYGYPNLSDGPSWATYSYEWTEFTKEAADSSVDNPVVAYSVVERTNGWVKISGFGENSVHKLSQIDSNVFYLAPYDELWHVADPSATTLWKTSAGTPFATA